MKWAACPTLRKARTKWWPSASLRSAKTASNRRKTIGVHTLSSSKRGWVTSIGRTKAGWKSNKNNRLRSADHGSRFFLSGGYVISRFYYIGRNLKNIFFEKNRRNQCNRVTLYVTLYKTKEKRLHFSVTLWNTRCNLLLNPKSALMRSERVFYKNIFWPYIGSSCIKYGTWPY